MRSTTFIAAVVSLAAGGVHLAAGGPHLQESVPLGVAFIVVGWLQLLLGGAVWARPRRATAVALAVVHVTAIGAWAVSRSVGLPFGHPGGAPFGVGGVTAVALEVAAIAALAIFVYDPRRVRRLPTPVALATTLVVLVGASVAVAQVETGHSGASSDEGVDDHHEGGHDDTEAGTDSGDAHADDGPPAPSAGDTTEGGATDRRSRSDASRDDGGDPHGGDGHDHDH